MDKHTRSEVRAVIIERGDDLPPFGLMAEVGRAEGLLRAAR